MLTLIIAALSLTINVYLLKNKVSKQDLYENNVILGLNFNNFNQRLKKLEEKEESKVDNITRF